MLALVLFALCLGHTQSLGALQGTVPSTAPGMIVHWTGALGAANTSWQNPSNWDPARVPGPRDSVIIRPPAPGAQCTVTALPPLPPAPETITIRTIDARDCTVEILTPVVADTITIARTSDATNNAVLSVTWMSLQATKYGAVSTDVKFGGGSLRGNWSFTSAAISIVNTAQFSGTFAFGVAAKHEAKTGLSSSSTVAGPTNASQTRRVVVTIDGGAAVFTPKSSVTFGAHALVLCRSGRCNLNGGSSETAVDLRNAAIVVRRHAKLQIEMCTATVGAVHLAAASELWFYDTIAFLSTVISTSTPPGGNAAEGSATLALAQPARVTAYGGLHASVSFEPVLLDLVLQLGTHLTILEPPKSRTAPLNLNSIRCSGRIHFGLSIFVRQASSLLSGVMKEITPTSVDFASLNVTGGMISVSSAGASHLRLYDDTNVITSQFEVTDSLYISALALRGTLRTWPRCKITLDPEVVYFDGIGSVHGPAPYGAEFIAQSHFTVPETSWVSSWVTVSLTRGATVLGAWQASPGPHHDAVFNATGAVVLGVGGSVSGQGAASIKNAIPGPGARGHLVMAECGNKYVSFPLHCPVGAGFKIGLE